MTDLRYRVAPFNWTEEKDQTLISLYEKSVSYPEIGKILNCKRNQISNRVIVLEKSGRITRRDFRILNKRHFTDLENQKIKKMYSSGDAIDVICKELSITTSLLHTYLGKMLPKWGIPRRGNIIDVNQDNHKYIHKIPEIDVEPLNKELDDLTGSCCKFPVNMPPKRGKYYFCGHKVKPGSNYCEGHHNICYTAR